MAKRPRNVQIKNARANATGTCAPKIHLETTSDEMRYTILKNMIIQVESLSFEQNEGHLMEIRPFEMYGFSFFVQIQQANPF